MCWILSGLSGLMAGAFCDAFTHLMCCYDHGRAVRKRGFSVAHWANLTEPLRLLGREGRGIGLACIDFEGGEVGDGPVGGRQGLASVGPARQLFPAFVVGEGVFDGDAFRGVPVAGSAAGFMDLGRADPVSLPRRGRRLPGVITAKTEVAVVEKDLDIGIVLEADPDAFVACGGRVVPPSRPRGIDP